MVTQEHSVIVDPTHFPGAIADLARILVPLTGQPSSTLVKRLENGEITIESDLSHRGADALVDRLSKMGVFAVAKKITSQTQALTDIDIPLDFDIDAIFNPQEESKAQPERTQPPTPITDPNPAPVPESNPWETLFPDLEAGQHPTVNEEAKKIPPSLEDLENTRVSPPKIVTAPPPMIRSAPRAADSMMRDIIPQVEKAPFQPDGFDDSYEHSPELAAIFAVIAPGAGHRYNGEDGRARSLVMSWFLILPWIRSIKQTRAAAEKIQSYHLQRPESGALGRTAIHITIFWVVLTVIASLATVAFQQFSKHTELKESEKTIARSQISEAIVSARLKHAEARFSAVEAVRAHLAVEPTQEISMTQQEHLERLYSVGVQHCRQKKYTKCQGIMARVSRLQPGYRDVLVLQAWASQQRSSKIPSPMPEISEVKSLEELEKIDK